MTKVNLKQYQGSDVIRIQVPGYYTGTREKRKNISRRYVWSKEKQEYENPLRGGKYEARRKKANAKGRETRTFDFLPDAEAWQRQKTGQLIEESFLAQSVTTHDPDGPTLGEVIGKWQRQAFSALRESTRIQYRKAIPHFASIKDVPMSLLKPQIITDWIASMKTAEKLSSYRSTRTSLKKELDTLRAIVLWFIEHNDDTALVSPFKRYHQKMLKIKESTKEASSYMTDEEVKRWLEALREESFEMYALGLIHAGQ